MRKPITYTAKKKRWHQKRYEGRLQSGLCPICGGKRTGDWITCITCREKSRLYSKALPPEVRQKSINRYRIKCRKRGICYGCGGYIGLGKYKRCEPCREKDRNAHMERYIRLAIAHQPTTSHTIQIQGHNPLPSIDRNYRTIDIYYRTSSLSTDHTK